MTTKQLVFWYALGAGILLALGTEYDCAAAILFCVLAYSVGRFHGEGFAARHALKLWGECEMRGISSGPSAAPYAENSKNSLTIFSEAPANGPGFASPSSIAVRGEAVRGDDLPRRQLALNELASNG